MKKSKKLIKIIWLSVLSVIIIAVLICFSVFINLNKSENIYAKNIMKVVEIKVSDDGESWGHATGCIVSKDGKILTNKHVVINSSTDQQYNKIFARFADEDEYTMAIVLTVSESYDLALIKIEKSNCDFFQFAKNVKNGEKIYTIGNPNGFGLSFTSGYVSSNSRNVVYNDLTIKSIQADFVINEGNSGGPIFNKEGKMVGLISFRLKDKYSNVIQGVSFGIRIKEIKTFCVNNW